MIGKNAGSSKTEKKGAVSRQWTQEVEDCTDQGQSLV